MKRILLVALILSVSINAQNVTNKLGGTTDAQTYDIIDSAGTLLFQVTGEGRVGIGTTAYDELLHVGGNSIFWGSLDIRNSSGTTLFKVKSDGKVGIGIASPDELFDVNGNMRLYGQLVDINGNGGNTGQILSSTGGGVDWIDAATASSDWKLTGNAGTSAGTNFVGTTDNTALEFKVNNARVMRYEPDATSPNVIGGYSSNGVTAGLVGVFIGGGGLGGNENKVTASFGSVLGGATNTAGGLYSTAMGVVSTAGGKASTAMGNSTTASGDYSTAMGISTTASGENSTAMGKSSSASGKTSTAIGWSTKAIGQASTAIGFGTTANTAFSTALGFQTTANGQVSTALGLETIAGSYGSLVMGRYNIGEGDAGSWKSSDPLFEIGIGSSSSAKNNAVTVLKNGRVGILTSSPLVELHIKDNGNDGDAEIRIDAGTNDNARLGFYQNGNKKWSIQSHTSGGDVSFYNADNTRYAKLTQSCTSWIFGTASDKRLKEDIVPFKDALVTISKINPVRYKYTDSQNYEIGLIAQELQKYFPELVEGVETDTTYLSINYARLGPILVQGIKELKKENDKLNMQLDGLISRIKKLENQ